MRAPPKFRASVRLSQSRRKEETEFIRFPSSEAWAVSTGREHKRSPLKDTATLFLIAAGLANVPGILVWSKPRMK